MTESLKDILGKKSVQIPPDALAIREYVKDKLRLDLRVESKPKTIVLYATDSSMAAHVRTYLHIIARDCGVQDKRILIRINTA